MMHDDRNGVYRHDYTLYMLVMLIVKLLLRNWILIVPVNSARSRYSMPLEVEIEE